MQAWSTKLLRRSQLSPDKWAFDQKSTLSGMRFGRFHVQCPKTLLGMVASETTGMECVPDGFQSCRFGSCLNNLQAKRSSLTLTSPDGLTR